MRWFDIGYLHNVELVDLAVPRKQRLTVNELAHNAPDCPQIYRRIVACRPQKQLWGAVPPAARVRVAVETCRLNNIKVVCVETLERGRR